MIQQDDEIRLKIVGTRVDKNDIVSLFPASTYTRLSGELSDFLPPSFRGFYALLSGRRDGWAEGLGLRGRGWFCAHLGFTFFLLSFLQFAIGSLMDDYLGECLIIWAGVIAWRRGV